MLQEQGKAIETRTSAPEPPESVVLALKIIFERMRSLPKADRSDMIELFKGLRKTDDPGEVQSIQRAMGEILAQVPVSVRDMLADEEKPMARGLAAWSTHVGGKIKELRERAGLNQTQLAEKAGLRQSHISRLENAEHSPTNLTLGRIAEALGVEVGDIDPCAD